jgi:hypothetical protein
MRRLAGPAGCVLFAITGSAVGEAWGQSIDGRVRLGMEAGLMEHEVLTRSGTSSSSLGTPTTGETDVRFTALGLGSLGFGPFIGYGISNQALVGAQLDILHQNSQFGDNSAQDTLGAGASLSLAYVVESGNVRPFFGPVVGLNHFSTDSGQSTFSETIFDIGARVGLLGFATHWFSIDPSVVIAYATGTGTQRSLFTGDPRAGGEQEHDLSGFSVGLRLAMSGWLGRDEPLDTGPDRDLDAMPPYSPPPDPAWGQPTSQQPTYPPAPPAEQAPPAFPPPGAAPAHAPPAPAYPTGPAPVQPGLAPAPPPPVPPAPPVSSPALPTSTP